MKRRGRVGRIALVLGLGVTGTLAAAWLPGVLIDAGAWSSAQGRRATVISETPLLAGPLSILLNVRRSAGIDWYEMLAFRDRHGYVIQSGRRDPRPEDVATGVGGRIALARLNARLRTWYHRSSVGLIEVKGWPVRCVWCEYEYGTRMDSFGDPPPPRGPMGAIDLGRTRALALPPTSAALPLTLPYRLIWWGVLVDVAFWSAVVATVGLGRGLMRRFVRRPRGACATCGYDLAGLGSGAACPECGKTREVLG